jgi:2-polyprenyl-6-methoxyphenol hydroxylase-like FAD-dependent oxidoreductase
MRPFHVIVVGGGMGGLALGNGLRHLASSNRNISFTIYERDEHPEGRNQGYQLGIQREGTTALTALGCSEAVKLWEGKNTLQRVRICQAEPTTISSVLSFGFPSGGGTTDRRLLRQVLAAPINDHVRWGSRFEKLTIEEGSNEGKVVAHFEDGSTARGDLIIAADGIKSKVRACLCPSLTEEKFMTDTGVGSFSWAISTKTLKDLRSRAVDELLQMGERTLIRVLGPGSCSWLFMINVDEIGKDAGEEKLTMVFNFNTEAEGHMDVQATPLEWNRFVAQKVKGKCIPLEEIIDSLTVNDIILGGPNMVRSSDSSIVAKLYSEYSSDNLKPYVALLGDSAHPMTTHRGLGANTAFMDAYDLAQVITSATETGISPDKLKSYHEAMIKRGAKAIADSLQSTRTMHVSKPWQKAARNTIISGLGLALQIKSRFFE